MRIHHDAISRDAVYAAARAAHVTLLKLESHGSRSRYYSYDVILGGSSSRRCNSRQFRTQHAATWDEWGIFLGHLFIADFNAIAGPYDGVNDFHRQTDSRFDYDTDDDQPAGLLWEDQHQHRWIFSGTVGVFECKCGAIWRPGMA